MKLINFINPLDTVVNFQAYSLLIHCVSADFSFKQTAKMLANINYYITEDLWIAVKDIFNITMELNIGNRQQEVPKQINEECEHADGAEPDTDTGEYHFTCEQCGTVNQAGVCFVCGN